MTTFTKTNSKSKWKALEPMTTKRAAAGGIFVNDHQFLAIGGQSGPREYLSSCEYYDSEKNSWNSTPVKLPTPRAFFGLCRVDDKILLCGGKESCAINTTTCDLLVLDLSECDDLSKVSEQNCQWKSLSPMNEPRHRFACVSHKNYIYVFGGKNQHGDRLATAEQYCIETNTWTPLPDLPCGPNNGCSAGVIGDCIYVVGGMDNTGNLLASTMVFHTIDEEWNTQSMVPDMKVTRWGLLLLVIGHYLVAMGGDFDKTIEVFDTQSRTWNFAPLTLKHDKSLTMASVCHDDDEILVAGGLLGIRATAMAETISFTTGLFPETIRFEKWHETEIGQKTTSREAKIVKSLAVSYKSYSKRTKKCCTTNNKRNNTCCSNRTSG